MQGYEEIGQAGAFAAKRAADRGYGGATEAVDVDTVQSSSLRACNARTLDRLNDLHINTSQLVDILVQLSGEQGPVNSTGSLGRLSEAKEPPEPSAPIFQARRIEQRLEQQIDMQRNLITKLRSLIG